MEEESEQRHPDCWILAHLEQSATVLSVIFREILFQPLVSVILSFQKYEPTDILSLSKSPFAKERLTFNGLLFFLITSKYFNLFDQ